MAPKYKDELEQRAQQFCDALQTSGFAANVMPSSFRDYQVKITVTNQGNSLGQLVLYYAPKKARFTLGFQEFRDRSAELRLQSIWDQLEHLPDPNLNIPAEEIQSVSSSDQEAVNDAGRPPDGLEPLQTLIALGQSFASVLDEAGFFCDAMDLKNDQYYRIRISTKGDKGFIDIYNTRRRPLEDPYIHGFAEPEVRTRLRQLWLQFLKPSEPHTLEKFVDPLQAATHYYNLLQPYADCNFDFKTLAVALDTVVRQLGRQDLQPIKYSDDFAQLEQIYHLLKDL